MTMKHRQQINNRTKTTHNPYRQLNDSAIKIIRLLQTLLTQICYHNICNEVLFRSQLNNNKSVSYNNTL